MLFKNSTVYLNYKFHFNPNPRQHCFTQAKRIIRGGIRKANLQQAAFYTEKKKKKTVCLEKS